jgi:phenylacetate-CoA ligase
MNKYFAKYFVYDVGQFIRREPVIRCLQEYERTQYYDSEKLNNYQLDKLVKLINYASKNIPYYNKTFQKLEYTREELKNNFSNLPSITKLDVRDNVSALSSLKSPLFLTKKTSGGSTGQAVIVSKDRQSSASQRALMYRGYHWAGIDIGDKQIRFWGVPINIQSKIKYKLIDYFMNRMRLSAFKFSDDDLERYYKKIIKFKPDYFYGYTSMLHEFAKFVKSNKLDGTGLGLKAIISTSEVLYDAQKSLIEEVFDCRVYNEYGCGEFGPIAFECEEGQMHINSENILVEIIKDGKPVQPGESGEIILTELNNRAMPLIRYRMGDIGLLSDKVCLCGRKLPVLEKIVGRELDFIVGSNGEKVHGEYFNYLMEEIQDKDMAIKQFQIVQKMKGEIEFHIVKDDNFTDKTLLYINTQLAQILGEEMKIKYIYNKKIKRLQSGKLRLVVSKL